MPAPETATTGRTSLQVTAVDRLLRIYPSLQEALTSGPPLIPGLPG
jgi:hypothetical protein